MKVKTIGAILAGAVMIGSAVASACPFQVCGKENIFLHILRFRSSTENYINEELDSAFNKNDEWQEQKLFSNLPLGN